MVRLDRTGALALGVTLFIAGTVFGCAIAPDVVSMAPYKISKCDPTGQICVGDHVDAPNFRFFEANLGSLKYGYCGYREVGRVEGGSLSPLELARRGCDQKRLVAIFDNGRHRVALWIDEGSIRTIQVGPRNTFEL